MNCNTSRKLTVLICLAAIAGIIWGEWLESRPNPLLEGWRMFGGHPGRSYHWRISISDFLVYAPFLAAMAGVLKRWDDSVRLLFSIVIYTGGCVGLLGLLAYPVLAPYGMRLGIMPFLLLVAVLWRLARRLEKRDSPHEETTEAK